MKVWVLAGELDSGGLTIVDLFSSEESAEGERANLSDAYAGNGILLEVSEWEVQE